jgi:hypothetical protein
MAKFVEKNTSKTVKNMHTKQFLNGGITQSSYGH